MGVTSNVWQPQIQQNRKLNVLEHVSFSLLEEHCIGVPKFKACSTKEEAIEAAKAINAKDLVVKAQVLAGGRGKGYFKNGVKSGVQMAYT